jgi:hypothetical protein
MSDKSTSLDSSLKVTDIGAGWNQIRDVALGFQVEIPSMCVALCAFYISPA